MSPIFDCEKLVRTIGFALRHNPAQFGLDLDEGGWASLEDLVIAMRFDRYDWALIEVPLLKAAIGGSDRFEIRDGRIRRRMATVSSLANPRRLPLRRHCCFMGLRRTLSKQFAAKD